MMYLIQIETLIALEFMEIVVRILVMHLKDVSFVVGIHARL